VGEETAQTLFDQRSRHARDLLTPASGNQNYRHERTPLYQSPPGLWSDQSLIDRDFVHSKGMNTQTLSHNIPVFNVDGSPNEAGQISEVVDVVLYYKTHSERMLLAVSGLGKQSLILDYDWLKDHNPRIDWEKGEVEMTHCPLRCEGGHTLQKEQTCQKRIEL